MSECTKSYFIFHFPGVTPGPPPLGALSPDPWEGREGREAKDRRGKGRGEGEGSEGKGKEGEGRGEEVCVIAVGG